MKVGFNIDFFDELFMGNSKDFIPQMINEFIVPLMDGKSIAWAVEENFKGEKMVHPIGLYYHSKIEASTEELSFINQVEVFKAQASNVQCTLNGDTIEVSLEVDVEQTIDEPRASHRIKLVDYSALGEDSFNWFKTQSIADSLLSRLRSEIIDMALRGDSSWIPYLPNSTEYYSCVFYILINLATINAVVFADNRDIRHLQHVNLFQTKREYEQLWDDNDFDGDNDGGFSVPTAKGIELISSCLGLYMNVVDQDTLKHLAEEYDDDTFSSLGSYIFLCPTNIMKFSKEVWAKEEDHYFSCEHLKFQGVSYAEDKMEVLYKLVFLHEIGHMAFRCLSISKKKENEETLANWVASIMVSGFERYLIYEKTKLQPREYRYFITRPDFENQFLLEWEGDMLWKDYHRNMYEYIKRMADVINTRRK